MDCNCCVRTHDWRGESALERLNYCRQCHKENLDELYKLDAGK